MLNSLTNSSEKRWKYSHLLKITSVVYEVLKKEHPILIRNAFSIGWAVLVAFGPETIKVSLNAV